MIICKIYENKDTHQKLVTVPKRSDFKPGDYVKIERVNG